MLLATGCGPAGSTAGSTAGSKPAKATPLPASQAIQLAVRQSAALNSLTATIDMTMRGSTTMNLSGTAREQLKPSLFADITMPSLTVDGQTVPGGMEEILSPSSVYLRINELSQMIGKRWLRLPFSELGGVTGGMNLAQLIQQAQSTNPATQAQFLAGATNVRTVGTSTIEGVPVTEYSGTIPMSVALRHIPANLRGQVSQQIQKAGITSASFEVWLDAQHQVRKLIMTEKGSSITQTTTMQVTSINQPVNPQLPPASQTATVPAGAL